MLHIECDGCREAVTVGPLRRRFHGSQGDHGWGYWQTDKPESLAPEGWVMFDPYTQQSYCPACWESIERAVAVPAGGVS